MQRTTFHWKPRLAFRDKIQQKFTIPPKCARNCQFRQNLLLFDGKDGFPSPEAHVGM